MTDEAPDRRGPGFEDQGDLLAATQRKMAIEGTLVKCPWTVMWGTPSANKSMLALWLAACGGQHGR